MFDNIRVAIGNLRGNPLRSALTMLGITIGVAAVIVLVSVGQAFETFVRTQFEGVGVNLIFVVPSANERGEFAPLTRADVTALEDILRVPDLRAVMPLDNTNQPIQYQGREIRETVQGVTDAYLTLFNRSVIAGRFFDDRDLDSSARVAVIEQSLVDVLFEDVFPVGQNIRIGDVRFTIIGVLGTENANAFGGGTGLVLPITTVQTRLTGDRILSGARPIDFIAAQAIDSDSVESAVLQIRQALRERREISFRDSDDFVVFTQTEILDTLGSITGLLTVFLALLASISLLVGGIGIMNIMLVTVTERTREIGLRKAVGAQRSDILLQFLIEAVLLSMIGGAVGVAIAVGAATLVTAVIPDLSVAVQLSSVFLATIISIVVGVFSGSYPASRAASLNPIDALRYE